MTEEETRRKGEEESDFLPVVDGELVEISPVETDEPEELTVVSAKNKITEDRSPKTKAQIANQTSQIANQKIYLLLPFIFLTVALLGGLRLASPDNAFVFWRPALFCLIAAAILMVLFFRAHLLSVEGWFSEDFTALKNVANGAVMVTLFAASAQIFNA